MRTAPDLKMLVEETVVLASLKPPPRNVRSHPERQVAELARAVEKFGQTRPLVIDEEGMVLAGNGLVAALEQLGRTEARAYRMRGLSNSDKTKLMLSDNRIFELGLDDHGAILEAIRGLDDLDIPGFDADILASLTLDTGAVTGTALDGYGKLPEAAVASARQRQIPPGSTEPAATAAASAGGEDASRSTFEATCPKCGHRFVPT